MRPFSSRAIAREVRLASFAAQLIAAVEAEPR